MSGLESRYINTSIDISKNDYSNHIRDMGIHTTERNKGFFRKPSIKIDELKPLNHEITIRHSPHIFQGTCWVLPILHKKWKISSINTSDCRVEVNIIENSMAIYDRYIPLYWRRDRKLPEECSIDTPRQELASKLPFAYMYALAGIASSTSPMPKGGKDELLFLFTYPEGQGVYIIPALSITEDRTDYFLLSYNTKYDVRVKFRIDGYSIEKRFSVFVKCWNDVRFHTDFSECVHKYWHCRRCPCLVDN